jgi:hypothetical protein
VTLQGPSLPFRGAEWGFENSLVTEWYPGNGDEATQQNLGPREGPSQWQGEWTRTRMGKFPTLAVDDRGNPLTIVSPFVLYQFLEQILRAGQRLRVTWAVASDSSDSRGKIVREGRCKSFKINPDRIQDIPWSVTWEWQSRGARVQKVTDANDTGNLAASAAAMQLALANMASVAAAQAFIASNASVPGSASAITLGQLEKLADAPTALVHGLSRSFLKIQSELSQVVGIATTLASQPAQIVSAAVNSAKDAIAVANQSLDALGQVPVEQMSADQSVGDLLRSYRYFGQNGEAARAAAIAAQNLLAQMQRRAATPSGAGVLDPRSAQVQPGDDIAMYVTKDGDTPQRISQRFYGSPDHAVDIMQANRLPWGQPTFKKGQILQIPALRKQQLTS